MIEEVEPRRTVLRRVRDLERGYIVCANVDRIFIVVAVSDPPYNRSFIDRLIVGVERDALSPVVVVNKIDLAGRESHALAARDMGVYRSAGLRGAPRQRRDRRGGRRGAGGVPRPHLRSGWAVRRRQVVVAQPRVSGCVIAHWESQRPRRARPAHHDGGRARTARRRVGGTRLRDRHARAGRFRLGDIRASELMAGFREIARAAVECRFTNCGHRAEPGCAVRRDVESGAIDAERYASWLKLREEITADATGRPATRRR